MKLTRLRIENFQALKHVDIVPQRSIVLLAGANAAGKSSIIDAVRLALCSVARVHLVKDREALVREGASRGLIQIEAGDEFSVRQPVPGKITLTGRTPDEALLLSSLTPGWFGACSADDRRRFLFRLTGVTADAEQIVARLLKRDCNRDKVENIRADLKRATMAAVAKDCAEWASQARGSWKTVTGENYGSAKAEGWVPTVPAAPIGTPLQHQTKADQCEAEIAALQQQLGALNAHENTAEGLQRRINEAAESAGLYARRATALNSAEKVLAEAQAKLAAATAKAEGGATPEHWPCPDCGSILMYGPGTPRTLVPFEAPAQVSDPEARASLPGLRNAVATCERAVANAKRDLEASDTAAKQKAGLEDQLKALEHPCPGMTAAALREQIALRQDEKRTYENAVKQFQEAEKAIAEAEATRDKAAALHRDVQQWTRIQELLEPAGIPGELLTEAIDPFNVQLSDLSEWAGWSQVSVRGDMEILYGSRPYGLCSESERWRVDAVLAIAIAVVSELNWVALDRMDVLDNAGRVQALSLLRDCAQSHDLEALVAGTFKTMPNVGGMADAIEVHWVEAGEITQSSVQVEEATA